MRLDQIIWDWIRGDQMRSNEIGGDQIRLDSLGQSQSTSVDLNNLCQLLLISVNFYQT